MLNFTITSLFLFFCFGYLSITYATENLSNDPRKPLSYTNTKKHTLVNNKMSKTNLLIDEQNNATEAISAPPFPPPTNNSSSTTVISSTTEQISSTTQAKKTETSTKTDVPISKNTTPAMPIELTTRLTTTEPSTSTIFTTLNATTPTTTATSTTTTTKTTTSTTTTTTTTPILSGLSCYQCVQQENGDCQGMDVDYGKIITDRQNSMKLNGKLWYENPCPADTVGCMWVNEASITVRVCASKSVLEYYGGGPIDPNQIQDMCIKSQSQNIEVCICKSANCNQNPICSVDSTATINICVANGIYRMKRAEQDKFLHFIKMGKVFHSFV